MYKITKKEKLADNIYLMDIEAPRVAKRCEPGQFVIAKTGERGERIPLTICDYDRKKGTVTIVFQIVGASTKKMGMLEIGDNFSDFTGPLGNASEFISEDISTLLEKNILFVAGGVGIAPVYPQVKWLFEKGITADVIIGARTRDMLILKEQMETVTGNLYIATDDGTIGHHGVVTDVIKQLVIGEGKNTISVWL